MQQTTPKLAWFIAAAIVVVLVLGVWFTVLFIKPKRTLPEQTPADLGLLYENVTLTTDDNQQLAAWYIPPPDDTGAVIIYLHGRSSNREHFLSYTETLYAAGYGAFLMDIRAHGESTGDELTYGIMEVGDVAVVVDYLQAQPEIANNPIVIIGHSLGASLAVQSAAEIEEIAAVIAFSPYSSITEVIGDRAWQNRYIPPRPTRDLIITFVSVITRRDYSQACPKCVIADIAPRRVLHVHGTADVEVPYWSAERILDNVGDNVTHWQLEGVDHMSHEWVAEHRIEDVIALLNDALN